MKNPITELNQIITDPVELTSITLPSAMLVVLFFSYKQHIHPELSKLPDPISGNILSVKTYGALLFLVITLVVSVVIKTLSHDLLNWSYNRFYWDRQSKEKDTWYGRCKKAGYLSNDPLLSQYQETLKSLRNSDNPKVAQVELLQTQSKLARSMSLIFFLFAVILSFKFNFVLLVVCVALSLFMLYTFFKERWQASELVFKEYYEEQSKKK